MGRALDALLQVVGATVLALAALFALDHSHRGRVGSTLCLPWGYAVIVVAPDTTAEGGRTWQHEGSHVEDCAAFGFLGLIKEARRNPGGGEWKAWLAEDR